MITWLTERVKTAGVVGLLVLMTLFDSLSNIISVVGDGLMAIIAICLLYPRLLPRKKGKAPD